MKGRAIYDRGEYKKSIGTGAIQWSGQMHLDLEFTKQLETLLDTGIEVTRTRVVTPDSSRRCAHVQSPCLARDVNNAQHMCIYLGPAVL